MPVRNLSLSADEVSAALGICRTAASRKVGRMEAFLGDAAIAAAQRTKSARPDRVRTAIAEQLQSLATLMAAHPDEIEPWITRLMG